MATAKKTTTKTAAKKTAAKKPAAKTAVKKTAAKTAAAKKPTTKTAAKKPAVKKAQVKKAAVKTASANKAVKAAIKKPAAKSAAKPASAKGTTAKAAPKKTSASAAKVPASSTKLAASTINKTPIKAAVKKPAVSAAVEKPVEKVIDPNVKYRDLFEAFTQGKLPLTQGYIISSFFDERSAYSIYEIVSYGGVKEIYPSGDGITFVTGGKKLHILVEPATYNFKPVEPVSRIEGQRIPKRFSELETIIAKNQSRVMIAKEPIETYGSFTVLRPQGINFAIVFYQLPDIFDSISAFFENSLNIQRKIPQSDAKKAAQYIIGVMNKHMGFEGQFS